MHKIYKKYHYFSIITHEIIMHNSSLLGQDTIFFTGLKPVHMDTIKIYCVTYNSYPQFKLIWFKCSIMNQYEWSSKLSSKLSPSDTDTSSRTHIAHIHTYNTRAREHVCNIYVREMQVTINELTSNRESQIWTPYVTLYHTEEIYMILYMEYKYIINISEILLIFIYVGDTDQTSP
jgi:hypothetical protein